MSTTTIQDVFKRYDVRGIYPSELNEELAYQIGIQFVKLLDAKTVAIGRDMRVSGPQLFDALAAGIIDGGATVVDIGLVSTDALYFAVGKYSYDGGIMLTASHNPAEYNGMKFTGRDAEALSLETGLSQIRDAIASGNDKSKSYKHRSADALPGKRIERDVLEDFAAHCLSFIDAAQVKPFKVAIDAGNGMGGKIIPPVFKHLPCEIVPLYFELDGNFPNHPANPLEPENIRDLQAAVVKHNCDLGVAFDGDADRMFILDEKGNLVTGDIVTALVAINTLKHNPRQKILYNVVCSKTVPEVIEANSGTPWRAPVGHSLIKKIMREEDIIFGGEHSGHFYFRDNWYADSGMIALLQCLQVFSESPQKVSEIISPIDKRFRSGEVNRKVNDIPAAIAKLETQHKGAELNHLDGVTITYPDWWMNIRSSNTEPLLRINIEADSEAVMNAKLKEVLELLA
ncbi:MAG: phosphomannomutase/phosphoglucomutase [Cyanobacteria bacterium SZAS-4]|nr:phosphomannomutase/phosphoglucomutase [Cyanobacteria bacterium SZAS-4]